MLGGPLSTSLIAGALADMASASAINIYEKIQERISPEDKEQLEKELVSSLKERIEGEEISDSILLDVIGPIDNHAVESVYLSQEEIADQIGERLLSTSNAIVIPSDSTGSVIAREAIDEALENWIDYISQNGRGQKYVLEGIWENEQQLQEIQRKLDAVVEHQAPQTRYSKIEVTNHAEAGDEVSKHLESGRPVTSEIFVDRPEVPEKLTEKRYLVIGRRGMGKTRTLDYMQSKLLKEKEIGHVVIPDNDFMALNDAEDFRQATFDGNVLLVWDDIQGLRAGEQKNTVRQSIVRLTESVEKSGNSLYILASLRSEFLDEIPNLDRTKDRAWKGFNKIRLQPLKDETVNKLFTKAADAHNLDLDEADQETLIQEIQYTAPSPLYVESVVTSINENQDIAEQIDKLPTEVQGIWETQYDRLTREHPKSRFVLWGIDLLRTGAIPLYKSTLRKLYSEVFNQDRFQFQRPIDVLKQKQWIWETTNPGPDISETVYATRAAQMSAVSEDRTRVIEEYVDFLLNSLPATIPDEVDDWVPTYYANTAMFLIEISSGETAEYAESLLEKAVELDPYNPLIRNNFATYFQRIGEPENSLEHYEAALSVLPEWADLRNTYAATLDDDLGRVTEAKEQYEKAIESSQPQPQAHFNLATLMVDLGRFEEARQHYEKALSKGYHPPRLYSNLGVLYTETGDYLEGIRVMKEGLEVSESDVMLRINLATTYLDIERPDRAVDILEPMLDYHSNSTVHGLLSIAYSGLGERKKAIDHGKRANEIESGRNPLEEGYLEDLEVEDIRNEPNWEEKPDLFRVFEYLVREENYSKAWEKGCELVENDYDSSEFRRMLADVAEILDLDDDAEQYYEKAIQQNPENGLAHHHYGNFLKHQNRFDEAKKRFREGLEVSDKPDIYNDYGLLLLQSGNLGDAVEVLSACLEKVQQAEDAVVGEARSHHNYAQALFHCGREEPARKHYQRAVELRDGYPEPKLGLGQLETETGNVDTGVEYFEEAMRLFAQNGNIEKWENTLMMAIDALENAGRIQDAIHKCDYGIETLYDIGGGHLPISGALQLRKSELEKSIQN